MILALLAAAVLYPATVLKVIDGDTLKVSVPGWPAPFDPIGVRVKGIDTPEHVKPPARSKCEVAKGVAAMKFARTLANPEMAVVLGWTPGDHDKYGRLLATVTLSDGRDWGQAMIAGGYARTYDGGTKTRWC